MSVKKINISGNEYDIKDANAQAMISDEFDSGTSYTTGDYCIYENVLYKFTSNKSAGAWDSGKVAATNIDTELSSLNSRIHTVLSDDYVDIENNQPLYTGLNVTIPANSYYAITGKAYWSANPPEWVGLASSPERLQAQYAEGFAEKAIATCTMCGYTDKEINIYLWAEYPGAGSNLCEINGFYITAES